MKKILCMFLVVCALASDCIAGAVGPIAMEFQAGGAEAQPMVSYVIVDNDVSKDGASWTQPRGYSSYRVWVENTTNYQMKVTIQSSSSEDSHIFYVSANDDKTYVVNDAVSGAHTITFSTSTGVLSGTVRVRVANVVLS